MVEKGEVGRVKKITVGVDGTWEVKRETVAFKYGGKRELTGGAAEKIMAKGAIVVELDGDD